jgi:hypothetical protein
LGESSGVSHGEIRQNLAVDFHPARLEAVHEFAIGESIQSSGGADALNPETPELPLASAAVAISIAVGAIGGFLGGLVKLAFGEEKTLRSAQILFAARAAFGATFYSSHGYFSCAEIARSDVSLMPPIYAAR